MTDPLTPQPPIRLAAALVTGRDGSLLLVRKRGTAIFMQPGGKIEPGEDSVTALRRELFEELGFIISPSSPLLIGRFTAPAANEPGRTIDADLFRLPVTGDMKLGAEIEEAVWVNAGDAERLNLAPFTRDQVLPIFRQMQEG